jgi:hypothetical protein
MAQLEATKTNNHIPDEIWRVDEDLVPSVQAARDEINRLDSERLLAGLKNEVKTAENGVVYAVLTGDNPQEYSDEEALVIFNPYANAATPNMLIRSEFIRRVAKHSEVRDSYGKLKPIVMLASPALGGSKLRLSRDEKKEVRAGNLGPAAKELLKAISTTDIGKVALLGYSQGAEVAAAGAKEAYTSNLDLSGLAVGDPIGIKDRSLFKLAKDFSKAAPDMAEAIERSGVKAQDEYKDKMSTIVATFMPNAIKSWSIGSGMAHGTFESTIQQLLNERRLDNITVAYGSKSSLSPPEIIEPQLNRLQDSDSRGVITSIRVTGATHAWDNQLPLLAKLFMRAAV